VKTRLASAAAAAAIVGSLALVPASALAQPAHAAANKAALKLHKNKLGTFLVDGKGMSLYLFEKDKGGKSSCFGACAAAWKPYMTSGKASAGKGVAASKIGTTKRAGGGTQVTYAGHPLYHYIGDTSAGQTNGEGSKAFGAEWYLVSPAGKTVEDH
jgi:predicted lipoprotein with Yx(FWY)xxD motif